MRRARGHGSSRGLVELEAARVGRDTYSRKVIEVLGLGLKIVVEGLEAR